MIGLADVRISGGCCDLSKMPTSTDLPKERKADILEQTAQLEARASELQEKLYADGREGLVIVLQALDAAGKDSTISHVMGAFNPQGVDVASFKQPSAEEAAHGFLWRAALALPERGKIAVFNRSYYEDVLVVRVHHYWKSYEMPKRCLDMSEQAFFEARYKDIRHFEEYLWNQGYRVLKLFLHVGKEKQGSRFLERIEDPTKHWKFSSTDMAERGYWDDYRKAYEEAIGATATAEAPWYVMPADQKWGTRWLVAQAIVNTLEAMDPRFPEPDPAEEAKLDEAKAKLLAEGCRV